MTTKLGDFPKPSKRKAKKPAKKSAKKPVKGRKAKKPDAPTVQPELQVAAPEPDHYQFDPSKPAAYETSRDHQARQAYMHRRQVLDAANRAVVKAEADLAAAEAHEVKCASVADAKRALSKARDDAMKVASDVAPKKEPKVPYAKKSAKKAKPAKKPKKKAKRAKKAKSSPPPAEPTPEPEAPKE